MDIESYIDHTIQLFLKRWLHHDRFILRSTLESMLCGGETTPGLIANSSAVSLSRVTDAYQTSRYESNEMGEIIDVFGVSVNGDRPFKVKSGDTTLNICCALVSLLICRFSEKKKVILTRDPISKQRITVSANKIVREITPSSAQAVLVLPSEERFCADQWNSFCKYVRLYESTKSAEVGAARSESAKVLSIGKLMKVASGVSGAFWTESSMR